MVETGNDMFCGELVRIVRLGPSRGEDNASGKRFLAIAVAMVRRWSDISSVANSYDHTTVIEQNRETGLPATLSLPRQISYAWSRDSEGD